MGGRELSLEEQIRSLRPAALDLFKRQLAALPAQEKSIAFSRLSGMTGLSDILDRPPPIQEVAEEPPEEVPLWRRGVDLFTAPFRFIQEKAIEPTVALATAPWTLETPETRNLPFFQRELEEYKQWESPRFVKGALEMLPWLAIPGTGALARGVGALAKGAGGFAPVVKGVAKGIEYSPWGLAEKGMQLPFKGAQALAARTTTKRAVLPSASIVAKGGVPPTKAQRRLLTSELFPEGVNPKLQTYIETLTQLIKEMKPIRGMTAQLQTEARAKQMAQYEAVRKRLMESGVAPRETLAEAEKALYVGGKLPEATPTEGFVSLADKVSEDMGQVLFGAINEAPFKNVWDRISARGALVRLLQPEAAGIPRDFELKLLERLFGPEFAKAILGKRPWLTKAWEEFLGLINAPRAMLASVDVSGLLRQGGILTARHPLEAAKTVIPMLKALLSDKNEAVMDSIIRSRPNFRLAEQSGLYIAPRAGQVAVALAEREEAFMSKIANMLPFVKASNRAYITVLNDMRIRMWESTLAAWSKAGLKPLEQDYRDLARLINWASGRGPAIPFTAGMGALPNAILFAPRLIMSRLALPLTILPTVTKSKLVRVEAWKTMLSFLGIGASILAAAKLSGAADIELDPRSADFGKMRLPETETRLDIWTGYAQYFRFGAQFAAAQRKTAGGWMQPVNRKDLLDRFMQTKLSPAAGLMADIVKGETYLGEELPPKSGRSFTKQVYQRIAPLAIQDLVDAYLQDGPLGALVSSVGFAGVGVTTYSDPLKYERDVVAQEKYGMSWDEVGRTIGKAAQLQLEQTEPTLIEAEREQEERFATGTPTIMRHFQAEGKAIEDAYRKAIELAAKEYRATNNGRQFREDTEDAQNYRRKAYASRAERKEYQEIVAGYNQPLGPEQTAKMHPGDILRREYYRVVFGPDMYDEYGKYRFEEAESRERDFLSQHGQQALNFIEAYSGAIWVNKPVELKALEHAREILRPYWQIADTVWAGYPPELKTIADQIREMARQDEAQARLMLKQYPQILRARELIALYRKQMRDTNPAIRAAYRLFYG